MATWIHPETEDIETLYVLMRQSMNLAHSIAEQRFTTTAYSCAWPRTPSRTICGHF